MSRPLLVLDAYLDPEGGTPNFRPWLTGHPLEVVRIAYGAAPPDPRRFAGAVITGSAACFPDGIPWGDGLLRWLHLAADADLPVLGVCFGHQALAEAFGGPGSVRKMARPEVGFVRVDVRAPDDPIVGPLAPSFVSFLSHEDDVRPDCDGIDVLAASEATPVQALRVRGTRMWGVQWHAEMPEHERIALLHRRAAKHPELGLDPAAELARASLDDHVAAPVFRAFLDVVGADAG